MLEKRDAISEVIAFKAVLIEHSAKGSAFCRRSAALVGMDFTSSNTCCGSIGPW